MKAYLNSFPNSPIDSLNRLAHSLSPRPLKSGDNYLVPCVRHDDKEPSLSLGAGLDGKLLVHCFAGCDARDVLRELSKLGVLPKAGGRASYSSRVPEPRYPATIATFATMARNSLISNKKSVARSLRQWCDSGDKDPHRQAARAIWQRRRPPAGTSVATYLASRGLAGPVPDALGFVAGLYHRESGRHFPGMVAAVVDVNGQFLGVHRTWLAEGGQGKAPVSPDKMTLGPIASGAARLKEPVGGRLIVGEGIESALSAWALTPTPHGCWAGLNTSGLKALILPDTVTDVLIAADHDANGAGQRAAHDAAERWAREGRRVRIALPPKVGSDWNDALLGRGA